MQVKIKLQEGKKNSESLKPEALQTQYKAHGNCGATWLQKTEGNTREKGRYT